LTEKIIINTLINRVNIVYHLKLKLRPIGLNSDALAILQVPNEDRVTELTEKHFACALTPLSDLAAGRPEIKQALIDLGHVLLCEKITRKPFGDLVCYHICRIEQLSGDRATGELVRRAVRRFRERSLFGASRLAGVTMPGKARGLRVIK